MPKDVAPGRTGPRRLMTEFGLESHVRSWEDLFLELAPPEPAPVPLAQKAVNFGRAVVTHARAGFPAADGTLQEARRAVCERGAGLLPATVAAGRCDHFRPSDGSCGGRGGCGCTVADKAAWAEQVCPLGRWPSAEIA